MGAIGASGGGHRVLAEILGAQLAWWQLGFALRRTVLRDARLGRRSVDPDVWDIGVGWAWQWLAAPRWWRLARDLGTTTLAVVCTVGLVHVMAEADGVVATSAAVAGWAPTATWWLRRQGRHARLLVRLLPDPAAGGRAERTSLPWRVSRALVALLAVGAAAVMMAVAIGYERSIGLACPRFAVDASVLEWWERDPVGCPAGDTLVDAAGLRYTPWVVRDQRGGFGQDYVVYERPDAKPAVILAAVFAVWAADGGPAGRLGHPRDGGTEDTLAYQNFDGGAIVLRSGGTPQVRPGERHSTVRDLGSPCPPLDRPCITTVDAGPDGIRVGWSYGAADAFNVAWWPDGSTPGAAVQREAAGYEYTVPAPPPGGAYVVEVAACRKQFLRRSTCTWPSARVIVRAG
ncbi:hypothetical protein ABTZ99_15780 [Actinosynnema sp. NPDC002837]